MMIIRGGVEDTTLEAKAKDTKKKSEAKAKDSLSEDRPSRGQGQECSRPRPRTKDTAASVLQKKNLQKSFSGNLKSLSIGTSPRFCKKRGVKLIVEQCKHLTLETC